MAYLENNNILCSEQFGFRKNRSTIDALKMVKEYIDTNITNKKIVCMISLDIKNAFGSIRRNSLLKIMDEINVPTKLKHMITDYLYNRKIIINDKEYLNYNTGVLQGSSLGPSLWLLIINELLLKSKNKNYKIIVYADDITILLKSSASFHFTELSKEPIQDIIDWCELHSLELSVNKCNFIMFKLVKNIKHIPRIKINNGSIKYTKELKYLGLIFDNNLSWIPHLNNLKNKIDHLNYKIKNIAKATWGLQPKIVKNIYYLVIEKMILYGATIWYKPYAKIKAKISQLQTGITHHHKVLQYRII